MSNLHTHYTGTNVSINIGSSLITECFGISFSTNQSKRPLYGYNDQHFSGVSKGVNIIQGQLFINYVHDAYLSSIIQRYFTFEEALRRLVQGGGNLGDALSYLQSQDRVSALTDVLRNYFDPQVGLQSEDGNIRSTYLNEEEELFELPEYTERGLIDDTVRPTYTGEGLSNSQLSINRSSRSRVLDSSLDAIFDDEGLREDLISYYTGGIGVAGSSLENFSGTASEGLIFNGNDLEGLISKNRSLEAAQDALMILANPEQFGDGTNGPHGIDIQVHFGPPIGGVDQDRAYSYQQRSSFVLKDCHFTGETMQIMSDDQPVLEVYNFFGRKKETIPRNSSIGSI